MTKDPVCGMEIDERDAAATSIYEDHPYYFCSEACRQEFDRNPKRYLQGVAPQHAGVGRETD